MKQDQLKTIPSVSEVLLEVTKITDNNKKLLTYWINKKLSTYRAKAKAEKLFSSRQEIIQNIKTEINRKSKGSLKPVINGTGIVLHTGLGRSPLHSEIVKRGLKTLKVYSNLEFDLDLGTRGNRQDHIQDYFKAITGGKSSLIVNNNAAAVLLGINTLAEGKEVVVSRGQEVEIGGAFRIPDIIEKSGGILREVGTTNRTHKRDVERAINPNTKLLLWVHTSNYKIQGFTKDLSLETLVEIGRRKRIPVMADLGSGAMENFSNLGLPKESMVHEIVKMKPQLITFSGDKLLGGPQSGIMIGSQRIINRCLQNPIYRTVRCDKFTIAFMEETLKVIGTSTQIKKNLTLSLLAEPGKKILKRVNKILDTLPTKIKKTYGIHSIQTEVEAGSGSLPAESLPSAALVFSSNNMKPKELAKTFRYGHPSLIGYIHGNKYFIDFKAVLKEQDKLIVQLIKEKLG